MVFCLYIVMISSTSSNEGTKLALQLLVTKTIIRIVLIYLLLCSFFTDWLCERCMSVVHSLNPYFIFTRNLLFEMHMCSWSVFVIFQWNETHSWAQVPIYIYFFLLMPFPLGFSFVSSYSDFFEECSFSIIRFSFKYLIKWFLYRIKDALDNSYKRYDR